MAASPSNPQNRFRFLRPEDIARLRTYRFAPRAAVEGYYTGRHSSKRRGASSDFYEYREYTPGDDPATVDWRVFARSDRYVVRTFEQETDMDCTILLDSSASMGFGRGPSKIEYASFFSAALAYLVIRAGDRVALHVFDEGIREWIPHGGTRTHLYRLLNLLERNRPGNRTSLAAALDRAFPLLQKRGPLVIVSDFLDDPAAVFTALNPYLHAGFRPYLFQVLDPRELELPARGLTAYVDMEDGRRVIADTERVRAQYALTMREHLRTLRTLAVLRRIRYDFVTTDRMFYRFFDLLNE